MNENENKYLVFKIGAETYGSPLLTIREVLEYQAPKHMPNMVSFFSGVINVRGAIVGVVDLRKKLAVDDKVGPRTAMLLCDTEQGAIVAVVDRVESVQEFAAGEVELKPPVKPQVDASYLIGVAKASASLITLLDLHRLLTDEKFKAA